MCVLNDCKYGFIASLTLKLLTQGLCKRSSDNLTPENDYLGNKSRLRREYGSLTMRAQTLTLEIRKKTHHFLKGMIELLNTRSFRHVFYAISSQITAALM